MLEGKRLDKSVPVPLYFQLKMLIQDEIKSGSYSADSPIPTEMELSQMFDISRTTVRQAISDLVKEGRLYRIKSKGTFVAHPKVEWGFFSRIQSFDDEVREAGMVPTTHVLEMKELLIPREVSLPMGLKDNAKGIYLYRKRSADDAPVVRVETYLPYDKCHFVLNHDFNRESLYDVLAKRQDTLITRIKRVCEAHAANSEDMEILEMKRGRPIHFFNSIGYNRKGEAVEYSNARYRGDYSRFRVEITRGGSLHHAGMPAGQL